MDPAQRDVVALRIAAQFLTARDACRLILLNRFFHMHYLNDTFKSTVARLMAAQLPPHLQLLQDLTFTEMLYVHPGFRNLVQNPCGSEGFEHWAKQDGGNGWTVEQWPEYQGRSSCFVGSYSWGSLTQTIRLQPRPSGKLLLIAGADMCARLDCGAIGEVSVEVKGLSSLKTGEIRCPQEKTMTGSAFFPCRIGVCRDIPRDTREVILKVRGKDTQFWSGNYGARFLYVFLYAIPIPPDRSPAEVCSPNLSIVI